MTDLSVVIPCHKEDPKIVEAIYQHLTLMGAEVIVVDDGGTMPELEIPYHSYTPHMGYGYAIKTGIERATRPLILTMDSDNQHRVEDAEKLYQVFNLITDCDMVVGCRWNVKENPIRWIGRKCINFFAVCWSRHMLPDLNSGMRIFRRDLALGYEPILCDTFSYTTSLTMCMVTDNHKVAWFPIDVLPRATGKSHVKVIKDGFITIWFVCWIGLALRTRRLRRWLRGR